MSACSDAALLGAASSLDLSVQANRSRKFEPLTQSKKKKHHMHPYPRENLILPVTHSGSADVITRDRTILDFDTQVLVWSASLVLNEFLVW